MKPIVLKNFIDEYTIEQLNNWTLSNYTKEFFKDANMGIPGTRLTTRYSRNFEFPDIAYKIKEKIISNLGIKFFEPVYKDGIINGIGFEGGSIYEHIDPVWHPDTYTLHCNIISQKSMNGGIPYIDGIPYETDPTDLLIYPVSISNHYVDEIKGSTPRILWVFGFSIDNETKIY
jgi:hypothetical protein